MTSSTAQSRVRVVMLSLAILVSVLAIVALCYGATPLRWVLLLGAGLNLFLAISQWLRPRGAA